MPLTLFDTLGHSLSSSDDKRRAAEARASSVAYPLSDPKRPTLSDSAYPLSDPKQSLLELKASLSEFRLGLEESAYPPKQNVIEFRLGLDDSAYPLSDPKRDARETGRRGGEARKASLSPERRHEIAVLANRARRAKKV